LNPSLVLAQDGFGIVRRGVIGDHYFQWNALLRQHRFQAAPNVSSAIKGNDCNIYCRQIHVYKTPWRYGSTTLKAHGICFF
jgi:hypothetical protein